MYKVVFEDDGVFEAACEDITISRALLGEMLESGLRLDFLERALGKEYARLTVSLIDDLFSHLCKADEYFSKLLVLVE